MSWAGNHYCSHKSSIILLLRKKRASNVKYSAAIFFSFQKVEWPTAMSIISFIIFWWSTSNQPFWIHTIVVSALNVVVSPKHKKQSYHIVVVLYAYAKHSSSHSQSQKLSCIHSWLVAKEVFFLWYHTSLDLCPPKSNPFILQFKSISVPFMQFLRYCVHENGSVEERCIQYEATARKHDAPRPWLPPVGCHWPRGKQNKQTCL